MEVLSGKVELQVSAKRLWQAAFLDSHNFVPKALPDIFSHITYEGPVFQAGSFRIVHTEKSYAERMSKGASQERLVLHAKERLVAVDHKAFTCKIELVDGGFLDILLKSMKQTTHIEEGLAPNTCVVHWSFEYEALSKELQPHVSAIIKDWLLPILNRVEEYLLSHNDYKDAP